MMGNKVIELIFFSMDSKGDMHGHNELPIPDISCAQGAL